MSSWVIIALSMCSLAALVLGTPTRLGGIGTNYGSGYGTGLGYNTGLGRPGETIVVEREVVDRNGYGGSSVVQREREIIEDRPGYVGGTGSGYGIRTGAGIGRRY